MSNLLMQAIERIRPLLMDADKSTKARVQFFWAATKAARGLAVTDVTHDTFSNLAVDVGLIDSAGRWTSNEVRESVRPYGAEDVAHVIGWALRGCNPFERGPLA